MSGFPRQNEIDVYYENKKKEVGEWLIEYAGSETAHAGTTEAAIGVCRTDVL